MRVTLPRVPTGLVLVLGLSFLSCFQATQVVAVPTNNDNRNVIGGAIYPSNNSVTSRDSDNGNSTSMTGPRPPVIHKPPTEEFCDINANCDYGYRCDDSGCVRWAAMATLTASTSTTGARKGSVRESTGMTAKKGKRGFAAGVIRTGAGGTTTVVLDTVGRADVPG